MMAAFSLYVQGFFRQCSCVKNHNKVQFGTYRNPWVYVVLRGDLKKTQFLVSDKDTVRIRRKTLREFLGRI
jgi:hypothetical protein